MTGFASDGLFDDGTVSVRLARPNLVFSRVRSAHYTLAQAETFVGPIWSAAREELKARRYVWVSDSRAIARYDQGARLLLTRWSLDHRAELEKILLLVSPQHGLVAEAIRVGCLASAAMGIEAFVEVSPEALLERHGIRWPGGL